MMSHLKRIRMIRRLALAGCVAAVIVPTSASAMLPDGRPVRDQNVQQPQQYSLPSGFHAEVQTGAQPYSPPAGFHAEVQTGAPQSSTGSKFVLHSRPEIQTAAPQSSPGSTFVLHKGFRPEVQTNSPAQATTPSTSVIRQIETVSDDSGRTLAIVLASIAMAIALCSLAYATIRVSQLQRRESH
jgi:hypothetical protein